MHKTFGLILILVILLIIGGFDAFKKEERVVIGEKAHWFELHRKSNVEYLYFGEPGKKSKSALVKVFKVKAGISGERPTPLPQVLGREYWEITGKVEVLDNPETAPYFLTLNVPVSEESPFGPSPYLECNGQCDWVLPGAFGLHGVNGDETRLGLENPGSSGCVRHSDSDIAYLYNLIDPAKSQVRYYIYDI